MLTEIVYKRPALNQWSLIISFFHEFIQLRNYNQKQKAKYVVLEPYYMKGTNPDGSRPMNLVLSISIDFSSS